MENIDLRIEYMPIAALRPYDRNARRHETADIDAIAASIKEFGFDDPIGIWSDKNLIVEGHGRLLAAQKLGMDSVPCIRLDHLTDEQRRAYALAHNRTAELSEWDFDIQAAELYNIIDIDMTQFGFDAESEEDEKTPAEEINPVEALPESRVFFFSISAFGTAAECFIEAPLLQEDADHLLEVARAGGWSFQQSAKK